MTSSQRRPIARRTRYGTVVALLATAGAALSGCAGSGDRAAGEGQSIAAAAAPMPAAYTPCGNPPVKLEKSDQDFLDKLAAAGGTRCTSSRTRLPGTC